MLTATKKFRFCYAHYLVDYDGPCNRVHGHNSTVEVSFTQVPGEYEGMCVDFTRIKKVVGPVIDRLDHQLLNNIIEVPTAENIVSYIVEKILSGSLGNALVRVRVSETDDSFAEWVRD